ncbi:MAG: tetratricopeptide repeat protein [Acidobacteriia bacterium]|nr:tetratricopeptide repeat protein [Terriglobia bacterium]
MTKRILIVLLATLVALAAAPAFAQGNTGTVKGKALDEKGNLIVGATVRLTSADGKKTEGKTDKQGEFVKTGVPAGQYKVEMLIGRTLRWSVQGFVVTADQDNPLTIDMAAAVAVSKMSAEQIKKMDEEAEAQRKKQEAEHAKIKNLNVMLAQATQMETTGDYDGAIGIFEDAVKIDPTRDLLWANLGGAYLGKLNKTSDKTQATQLATKSMEAFQKAISIKPTEAGYHNNLGQAYARAGKSEDALKEFTQAAKADPIGAARYCFNAGAILTNEAMKAAPGTDEQRKKLGEANEMFRKSIAADPKYNDGEAYYQLGTNLLNQVTLGKDGAMIFPEGTAEAFQNYLATAPTGRYAEIAKQNLTALGSKVETTYKKRSEKKK